MLQLERYKRGDLMKITVADKCPNLVREWHERNLPLMPSDVTIGSNKRIWWRGICGHEWQAIIKNRVNGSGCPFCSGNQLLKGFNDLASVKPELVGEWSEKNHPLKPDMVLPCSNKSVWWKCIRGHEWMARISDRYYGSGCPYCEGHMIYKGFNDFASRYPKVAIEWSEKNLPLLPDEVFPKSRQNVWWKCHVCGHEWKAVIDSRVRGAGCPVCDERRVKKGVNDLQTTDPEILEEWDYERNITIQPAEVSRSSLRVVWWKGACGHRWRAKIADRVLDKEPCHICKKNFDKAFPDLLLRYYIGQAGYTVIPEEEELIGVGISNYICEKRAAIEISKKTYNEGPGYRREIAKTELCRRSHIKLIRIITKRDKEFDGCVSVVRMDNSDEALAEAIALALSVLKIEITADITNDKKILFQDYIEGKISD